VLKDILCISARPYRRRRCQAHKSVDAPARFPRRAERPQLLRQYAGDLPQ
jgi:hypothetical protein